MVGALGAAPRLARAVSFDDTPSQLRGPSSLHMPLLTLGMFGTELVWSMEMSFASPYLVELGLSKAQTAAVLVAGPISGFLVQPIIGALADASTHKWGRRRPIMLLGCLISFAAMIQLAFAKDLAAVLTVRGSESHRFCTQVLAVLAVFGVDFSVNAVMSVDRSLYIDMLPASAQGQVGAWAARLAGVGSVLGFLISHMDLPKHIPFSSFPSLVELSKSGSNEGQLKCLCIITSLVLLGTHSVTAYVARERRLTRTEQPITGVRDVIRVLSEVITNFIKTARILPEPFRWVLSVQRECSPSCPPGCC